MNISKYILALVIIILIYWVIFNKEQKPLDTQLTQNQINQTPYSEVVRKKSQKKKTEAKKPEIINSDKLEAITQTDPHLTYLQAYRDYIYFGKCRNIINQLENNQDPVAIFIERIEKYAPYSWAAPIETPIEIMPEQLNVFNKFLDNCRSLLASENELYDKAKKRLDTTYQSIKPVTQEEINLADGLELYDQYNTLKNNLNKIRRGENSLDQITINNINQKIKYLRTEIKLLSESGNIYADDSLLKQHEALKKEINILNRQLNKDRIIDQEEIKYFESEFSRSKTNLFDFLKQNTSPDLFLVYSPILFLPNFKNASDKVFNAINVHDYMFQIQIYNIGVNLVACAMNYPCDEDSLLTQEICIHHLNPDKTACGKSLEEYYFNYLLGPNQLQDIENYLNYMLKYYAKN